MAEDFQTSNWYKTSRSRGRVDAGGGDDYDGVSSATSNVACSTKIADASEAQFAWPVGASATRPLMDSTLQLSGFGLSSPSMDWNQTLLSSSGRGESSFQAMLQEDLNSRSVFSAAHESSSSTVQFKHINHPLFFDNSSISSGGFPLASSTSSSSSIMQGFLETDSRHEQSLFDSQQLFHYQQSQIMQQKQQSAIANHLQFTNNTPFWNASSFSHPFDLPIKSLEGGGQEKKSSSEPAMKKIRVETASTLPTFKVRKEKLGDRITALQQLVSPFGKTDTASVLHEAIEYIKFLHDQVSVLSTPYLKNGHPMQQQQQSSEKFEEGEWQKQDLRSRGLCLVPISSTYPVATETNADFWTPTFGGSYR